MLQPRQAACVMAHVREEMPSDALWAVHAEELEFPADDDSDYEDGRRVSNRKVRVVMEGIAEPSKARVKLLVKNPLLREAVVVPKGTVVACVSGHANMCDLMETAPLLNSSQTDDHAAAKMVPLAEEQEKMGMLEPQGGDSHELRDEMGTMAAVRRWLEGRMPRSRAIALLYLGVWVLWSCTACCSGDQVAGVNSLMETEDWNSSLSKVRQRIATLPKGHPLNADEQSLRAKTREFCSNPGGMKMYSQWQKKFGSAFAIEYVNEVEKEEYLQFLFQFREVFDTNPKAPKEIKGVECALCFRDAHVLPRAIPVPRLTPQEWKHMESETDTMLKSGIVRFSESNWACVPVFAKKKDALWESDI